jgi:hypothetical protein
MSNARGIDCSHWQTATPSLAGLDFLIARATYATTPDDKYAQHFANGRKANVVTAAFHFGVGAGQATIASQASAFLRYAGAADLLNLDLESNGTSGLSMSGTEGQAFIAAVKSADTRKRKVGLYHSASGYPDLGQDYNWVAEWGATPPAIKWTFWQYRGSPLDLDYFNGDRAALNAFIGGTTAGPVVPIGGAMSTVILGTSSLNPPIVGTLTVKPDPAIRWVDLATGTLMGPPGVNFGSPYAVVGTIDPPVGTESQGYQVTINGKASFMLSRNVTFTPAPKADSVAIAAAVAADRLKAKVVWS